MSIEPSPDHKAQRMREDADMIQHPNRWPQDPLRLKTQPWITNRTGVMRFAGMAASTPLVVYECGRSPQRFGSIEELVEMWSVD